jgi:HEAT repeat protein
MKEHNWDKNIAELAKREVKEGGWKPASEIAWCFNDCREGHLPLPPINGKVIEDILFQFRNPQTALGPNDLKEHREICAAAIATIGDPKAVPLVIECLKDNPGSRAWGAVRMVGDERLLPIIDKALDSLSQQDALPAIAGLSKIGRPAIPALTRVLRGGDRALKRAAIESLVQIALPECLAPLKDFIATGPSEDQGLDRKTRAALATLQCRVIDKTYVPPKLAYEDDCRLHHLVRMLILADRRDPGDQERSEKATAALLKMGGPLVASALRPELANKGHGDAVGGPRFFVSERVANVMVRLGDAAIPALLDTLNDEMDHAHEFAAKALSRITGQDFGTDYARWRQWCVDTGRIKKPSPATQPGD